MGIPEALFSLHADHLWIEGDSSLIIGWITQYQPHKNSAWPLIRDILIWKSQSISHPWKVSHAYREANQAADWLASNSGCGSLSFYQYDVLPIQLCSILQTNALGLSYLR